GLGITFNYNGSTGGTDIIAAIVNKYRDVTLGRMIMICDLFIISSCYFVFQDWRRVIFGFVTLFIIGVVLDWIVNSARQSVQFLIFSQKYDEIADSIIKETHRGVTVLNGTGWYSKTDAKVLVVLAKKRQSLDIFRLVKSIDPNAFISQSSVIGVFGEGFDKLKVK
ncbi:MAG TPA: YitT family protein, partial [Bacteroides reticulotermitis]|nr:YitT family protein [Bacteroides reticulotermitis]